MTLAELTDRLVERAAEAERIGATAPVAAVLRDVVRQLSELNGSPATVASDKLIPLEVAAKRLSVEPRWLRENRPPYVVQLGDRTLRVSERKLERFLSHQGNGAGS